MFKSLGLLQTSRCPDEPCLRPYCFFAHTQATAAAGPSRLPVGVTGKGEPALKKRKVDDKSSVKPLEVEIKSGVSRLKGAEGVPKAATPARVSGTEGIKSPAKARVTGDGVAPSTSGARVSTSTRPGVAARPPTAIASASSSRLPTVTPRPAAAARPQVNGAPSISRDAKDMKMSKQPYADRQKALQTLFTQYTKLYTGISTLDPDLASRCSIAEELDISASSTDLSAYKRAIHHAAVSVSRRAPPDALAHPSVGTVRVSREATLKVEKEAASRLTFERCKRYLLPVSAFPTWRYPEPNDPALIQGDTEPDGLGSTQKCDRCGVDFVVSSANLKERMGECVYHFGRLLPEKRDGKKMWLYSCCQKERGAVGCYKGVHIFNEREDDVKLASRVGFKLVKDQVEENRASGRVEAFAEVVGMDCEMIYTTAGYSLARATIVDEKGETIFDELVRQTATILDLNTRFSGITQDNLDGAVMDIKAVRAAACMFIGPETIIVGHGLENDLRAMRLLHDKVIDTAVLIPHHKGAPFRRALRDLVKEKLGYFIQQQATSTGHSSAEDAKATLEVLKWKVRDDAAHE